MVEIKKVETRKELEQFIDFHYDLYKDNAYDAPALFMNELQTLDCEKNPAFDFCEAEYYLALKDGKVVGRVAAIINHKANRRWEKKSVRFGWLDFVDDREVSAALMKAVEDFGRRCGMTEMIGPLGFTDFDPEGMLTEGFDQMGTMSTIYNYPYYPAHFEQMEGFEKDNDYVEYFITIPQGIPDRMKRLAEMVMQRYQLRVRSMTRSEITSGGMGHRVFRLINETFKDLYGYSELSDKQIDQYVAMYLPHANMDLIPIIEDMSGDEPKLVGVGITLPSLTNAVRKCRRGRLLPFGWWHLLKALKGHGTNTVDLEMIGVAPEYRNKGLNVLIFYHLIPFYNCLGLTHAESQVEMEGNAQVRNMWDNFEHTQHKRRRCYKKIF